MRKSSISYIIIVILSGLTCTHGQQLSLFNQYRMNEFLINPSVAGYDGYTSFNATAREQWIGLSNPPRTNTFSFQTRLLKRRFQVGPNTIRRNILRKSRSGRVGIGGFIYNEQNGLIRRTGAQFSYAYHIHIGDDQLSFGLAGFIYQFNLDIDQIRTREPENEAFLRRIATTYIPDVGVGMSYTSQKYMFGFSATHLLASRIKLENPSNQKYAERYFYGFGKYRYEIAEKWNIEPMLLIKSSERFQVQADLSNVFIYDTDYWFGIGYRTVNSMMVLMGMRYDRVYFGYSFDYTFSDLTSGSIGSHEFSIALKLGDSARRYRWLERY